MYLYDKFKFVHKLGVLLALTYLEVPQGFVVKLILNVIDVSIW